MARRRGVWRPVAMVVLVGGGGCVRWCRAESRGGEGVQGERGEDEGVGGVRGGDQAVEGGHAGREKPARLAGHRARSCFSSWQEEEDSAAPDGPGWLWPVGLLQRWASWGAR